MNVNCHENAIHKGSHSHYRIEAVLDGSKLSNFYLSQPKPFHVNLHTPVPHLSTSPLTHCPVNL